MLAVPENGRADGDVGAFFCAFAVLRDLQRFQQANRRVVLIIVNKHGYSKYYIIETFEDE